jgi:hypothetical protein
MAMTRDSRLLLRAKYFMLPFQAECRLLAGSTNRGSSEEFKVSNADGR